MAKIKMLVEQDGGELLPLQYGHAEEILFNQYGNQIKAIGVSNPREICSRCAGILIDNNIQGAFIQNDGTIKFVP